jgi:ATP-binding cassette subfamily F protein 3
MITLNLAGKRFGPKLLFENVSWLITAQERAGLVGGNGTGKSTLLKVLGGMETLDYGTIQFTKGMTIGYLPQDGLSLRGRSVFAECMSVFDNVKAMEQEMEALTVSMSELDPSSPEYNAVTERFHRLENEFTSRDGYNIESQVGMVLDGLGFQKDDWRRPTEEFSGGWQMRIALGKLLLERPNLLLLDEPTNHLDIEARDWLEHYLQNYPYAFIMISHDRYFLDVTVKKIVEIWNKGMHFYSGNYEKYLQQKTERREQLEAAYRNQKERIDALEAFINRFRAQATKAKQVQSRIKELEKIERIEIPPEEKTIHFSFPQPRASGRVVAECKGIAKVYGSKTVFSDVSFTIERGERVVLVGHNGAGKSTLIKLLSGAEPLTRGTYTLGHNVDVDYFAQDQYKELDVNATLLDDITSVGGGKTQTELRSLLGCFLFSEDDVYKRIGVLSGGERNRYALAKMLLRPSNFMLLDEPTNHLDMRAKDVLLESLASFTGTVVLVSHDRYFIDKLATKVFEVGGGGIEVFPGNYEEYLWKKTGQDQILETKMTEQLAAAPVAAPMAPAAEPKKRVNPMKLKQMEDRCQQLEQAIARAEVEIAELEGRPYVSAEESLRIAGLLEEKRGALEKAMAEWEETSAALEALA